MDISEYFATVFSLTGIALIVVFLIVFAICPILIYHRLGRIYEALWILIESIENKDKRQQSAVEIEGFH